jgi:hypothetical protein
VLTRRALLIYNFGLSLILVAVGLASIFAADAMHQSSRVTNLPTFDKDSREAIEKQPDLEQLRSRALFYFELARELKKARTVDNSQYYYDARRLAFIVAGLFALAGIMILTLPEAARVLDSEPGTG